MRKVLYDRKVNFYETDAQGIVHHSNYPRYFEEARGFFLEKINYPYEKIREELNIDIVLLEIQVTYKEPLFFGDRFYVEITLKDIDRFFFTFEYNVLKNKKTISTGKTKHCCLDRHSRRIVSVPNIISNLV